MSNTYYKDYAINYLNKYLKINKSFFIDLFSKFNIENYFKLIKIHRVISTITIDSGLKNESDLKIINSLSILDILFCKKSEIVCLDTIYIRKAKTTVFTTRNTLNN
jgi:hypothetical protein